MPAHVSTDDNVPHRTAGDATHVSQGNVSELRKYDNPWMILFLLFFVTAALGLPMVWYSKSFSPATKVVLNIVVSLYTVAILGCFGGVMYWVVNRIMSAL
jgi:hypothetical protein